MSRFQMSARKQPEKPQMFNFDKPASLDTYDTKIIAFSGKLGAGKSSCANFLHALSFTHVLGITQHAYVNEKGKLVVRDKDGKYDMFNLDNKHPDVLTFLSQHVWPFMKKYSCADRLKESCHNFFGIPYELLYGNQEDKSTLISLSWEDMPTYIEDSAHTTKNGKVVHTGAKRHSGKMSVRELLEYFGTEILRKMHEDCHAESLIRKIEEDRPVFAVIDDVRFINEVKAIQNKGGKVIRLTLESSEAKENSHKSNTELDGYDSFDATLDNANLSMEDAFNELSKILLNFGWFKVVE